MDQQAGVCVHVCVCVWVCVCVCVCGVCVCYFSDILLKYLSMDKTGRL